MKKIVRITGTRKLLANEPKFKFAAKKVGGVDIDFLCYLDIYYDGAFRYIRNNKKIKEYDVFRIGGITGITMKRGLCYYYGMLKKKKFLDKVNIGNADCGSKFNQLLFLDHYGFSRPKSAFFIIDTIYIQKYIQLLESRFSYPFIAKDVHKDRGEGVFLIKDNKQLKKILKNNPLCPMLFQEYITNTGDFRVLVMGDKIIGGFKRYNPKSYKNNISDGGSFEKAILPDSIKKIAIDITKKYGLSIAGLDFFIEKNTYHVIEINELPQYAGAEAALNINYPEKIFEYIKKNRGKL